MIDELGTRMKEQYENRTRMFLPRRTYTIIRLDGKAFHTYTRGLEKPFDAELYEDMDNAIIAMLPQIQGAKFAYTQSDEISILLTDFETPTTSAWFDGNIQKMVSVSASIITAEFNKRRAKRWGRDLKAHLIASAGGEIEGSPDIEPFELAFFDSRTFTIPDPIEVMNYFIWRNQDCSRNSVSMVAQANFSHKELHGKSTPDKHEMLRTKGINWATDYTDGEKNGRLIVKQEYEVAMPTGEWGYASGGKNAQAVEFSDYIKRTRWVSTGAWKFTENKDKLKDMIPTYE